MNKVIWKFAISFPHGRIEMPEGAIILCVQAQHDIPYLWALCDPKAPKESRKFVVYGTGQKIKYDQEQYEYDGGESLEYLGTCQVAGGDLVWHVFEDLL